MGFGLTWPLDPKTSACWATLVVMVDLVAHCLPPPTISDVGGATWEWGSPFLVILVPSSCFSDATVSDSYGVDLGGPASLLL